MTKFSNKNKKINKLITIILLFSISFLLNSVSLFAGETGKISGKVTDIKTGETLFGANIVVVSRWVSGTEEKLRVPLGASTDVQGDYFILNVPPGSYNVKVSYIGYQEELFTKVEVNVDKTTKLNFKLTSTELQGKEVVVQAYKPNKVETDLTATKQVYNIEEIQTLAGVSNVSDILDLQPDVIDDHFRGGRVGESMYLIANSSINNPLTNKRSFNPIVNGLQQVEVFTSGFSAEYGNAQSGIVNMVTKEGGEKWRTTFEASGTAPYYKTFGSSPYSFGNLYMGNLYSDIKEWLKENPIKAGSPLFDIGYGFLSRYLPLTGGDTLKLASMARILWLQAMRDAGMEYNNTIDNRVDFSIGGPVTNDLRLFIAGRSEVTYADIPTANPDMNRQLMSNLTYQLDNENKLGLRYVFDYQFSNDFGGDWKRWLLDRSLSVGKLYQRTHQIGFDWKHTFSQSTILETNINILNVLNETKVELIKDSQWVVDYFGGSNWVNYTTPAFLMVGSPNTDKGKETITSYDIKSSILTQFNKFNLIKAGLQFTYYDLNVDRDNNLYNQAGFRKTKFNVYPYEGAFYIQDKMEFEGFIANIGLRFDFYNMNATYYSDIYSPLRNPYYDPSKSYLERGSYYDRNLANKTKSEIFSKLQPRVGISFPVTEFSVFHLNYGTFTQRPSFNQIFYNQVTYANQIEILGNPRLKPENTKTYDIGLVNALPYGLRLDLSAYYKDVTDLVETAYYYDEQQNVYQTYINRDYADIKGFNIIFERVEGSLRGSIRYNYETSTGKSANALDAPVTYFEKPAVDQNPVKLPDPEDVYMDYDRTHKAVFNLSYRLEGNEGPELFGINLLENMNISMTFRVMSGRPYTWDELGEGNKFNQRTPSEKDMRIRIEKRIKIGSGNLTIYAEGFNLLNEKVYRYSSVFQSDKNKSIWENDRKNNTENILIYNEFADRNLNPYQTSQAVYVLQNEPIHFRFGLIYKF